MNGNLIVGIASTTVGIIYSINAMTIPKAAVGNPLAPIYFPLGIGVLMGVIGVILIVQSLARGNSLSANEKRTSKDKGYPKLIAITVAICLVYAFIFNRAGYLVSTLLFLGSILFLVNGRKGWLVNILVTVIFTFGIQYLFEKVLMIGLP